MFNIDVSNMYWITEGDDPNDLCAHGDMVAIIGDEKFEFSGTASSTAIYLLKTLEKSLCVILSFLCLGQMQYMKASIC